SIIERPPRPARAAPLTPVRPRARGDVVPWAPRPSREPGRWTARSKETVLFRFPPFPTSFPSSPSPPLSNRAAHALPPSSTDRSLPAAGAMESSDPSPAAVSKTQEISVPPVEGVAGGGTSYGWVDGGLQGSHLGSSVIDPTKVHSADLLHVWSMPSTANVSQQEAPRPLEHVNLLAARNERESFQIALRPKVSWASSGIAGPVQIQCTDLCSSSGGRLVVGQSITLRHVVPILGVPDALVPIDPSSPQINLLPGETTAVWVSLNVPCGQEPGLYEGEICITAVRTDSDSKADSLPKSERYQLYKELKTCLDITESRDHSSSEEMILRLSSTSTTLRRMLVLPAFQDCHENNGLGDMMDEDVMNNVAVRVKLSLTVWDFTLPLTPSLPAVFGISETVIEDRFCLEHGTKGWYDALDHHFRWLLQYRISPFFCRWGDSMRILAYTCPWPGNASISKEKKRVCFFM
uniref:Uncharacterized protein n=1 Tax=Aegilops tauschii subsp. strangulata TaxID=200361 RepID=A0A453B7S5_AEGTS